MMTRYRVTRWIAAAVWLVTAMITSDALAREQIRIVGSSTVYPFTTVVAEEFGRSASFKTPIIESTGTGGGLKLFCAGTGDAHPDIANASRRIKASEIADCKANGVSAVTEVKIGYDGIAIARSNQALPVDLTRRQIFLALAREIPTSGGQLVENPNKTWKDVDASLPDIAIEVLGPPPTSGTRDAFNELALEGGCEAIPEIAALKKTDKKEFERVCRSIREDGGYVEAGENDNLIVQKLISNPDAFGVFGFSFLDQNRDKLRGSSVDGVEPSFENIADGQYPISRPMFIYVKGEHVGKVPGIREFVAEFTSESAVGDDGYLADRGLIPAPKAERDQVRANAESLTIVELAVEH